MHKIFSNLENSKTSLLWFIISFFAIIAVRNFAEIFSDNSNYGQFTHYFLFYISILLSALVLFKLFTKESITKLLKVLLAFCVIIISPPVIDLLLSSGKGYNISYIFYNDHLINDYLLFFGEWSGIGITPGMRIEIFLFFLFSFFYIFYKTKKVRKSFLFCLCFYSLVFFYFALPAFLEIFFKFLIFPTISLIKVYNNEMYILFYLILIFPTSLVIFYLHNKNYFIALMKDARWLRIVYYVFMFVFGAFFAKSNFEYSANDVANLTLFLKIIVVIIAIFLAWIFSLIINNITDQDIDKISNQERPLIKKTIDLLDYYKICAVAGVLALMYSFAVDLAAFYSIILFMGVYFLYSAPPFRFKRLFFVSKMAVSINSLVIFMLGWAQVGGYLSNFPKAIAVYFIIFITAIMNFIDIKDYEGDKANNIKTLPVVLGIN